MLWRFIPMTDPTVSVMASRDLDSLLTQREAVAVAQWLEESEDARLGGGDSSAP